MPHGAMSADRKALTTATLVTTARASHALVTGGIWVTQASMPTGISVFERRVAVKRAWESDYLITATDHLHVKTRINS